MLADPPWAYEAGKEKRITAGAGGGVHDPVAGAHPLPQEEMGERHPAAQAAMLAVMF